MTQTLCAIWQKRLSDAVFTTGITHELWLTMTHSSQQKTHVQVTSSPKGKKENNGAYLRGNTGCNLEKSWAQYKLNTVNKVFVTNILLLCMQNYSTIFKTRKGKFRLRFKNYHSALRP